jgi:hypothetical protein
MSSIVTPFPRAPREVVEAARRVGIVALGETKPGAASGDIENPPLPWEPGTCPAELRQSIWEWCEAVAGWLNHEYAWRPAHVVPPCWPYHPNIARELAALSFLHWQAETTADPQQMEEWNRNVLPLFFNRLIHALGPSGCRDGEHVDWPAEGRYVAYISNEWKTARRDAISADTD